MKEMSSTWRSVSSSAQHSKNRVLVVSDLIMPALGKVIGSVNFADLAISLGPIPPAKRC